MFSTIRESNDLPVNAIFTEEDIPNYHSMPSWVQMCKNKQKIDAIVNSYGYSEYKIGNFKIFTDIILAFLSGCAIILAL